MTIVGLLHDYLIKGIFVSVLVIIVCRAFFKSRFDTEYPLAIIRWILISYAVLTLLNFLLIIVFTNNSASIRERATGPYAWAFWLMTLSTTLLPLSLFLKPLQNKAWFIFIITVFVNIGWLMESLVIHTTSLHRDYVTDIGVYLPFPDEIVTLVVGFFEGILIIIAGNLFPKTKN